MKLLLLKASFSASAAVCLSSTVPPTTFLGVVSKKAKNKPITKKIEKNNKVSDQPYSTKDILVNKGETKYPNEPAAVTIPEAIVLLEDGKCFDTTDTGILTAVAPRPIPIKIPIFIIK